MLTTSGCSYRSTARRHSRLTCSTSFDPSGTHSRLAVGWRCEPLACGDATIYDAPLDAAGGDDAPMTDEELVSFQTWRRAANVMWVSELLRADGRTLRTCFDRDLQRRARNCKVEALRLWMMAFGHGRTRPARRRRVGIPKPALWTVLEVGELLWRANAVCEITQMDADSARVRLRLHCASASTRVCRPRHGQHSLH